MNPSGNLPVFDMQRCTHCGACVLVCPEGVLKLQGEQLAIVHPDACTCCAECEAACPENAVRCELEITWDDK